MDFSRFSELLQASGHVEKNLSAFIASDVEDFSRDDEPTVNFYINPESVNDFYNTVIKLHDEYRNFSVGSFLCRSFIFSGKFLTLAGALMFGNIIRVRAALEYSKRIEIEENNIWDAYKNILPRIANKLSARCSHAFQEIFVNALLHSDYKIDNFIDIIITSNPPKVLIDNPGIIKRTSRNHRLAKIFELAGLSQRWRGLWTVEQYMSSFRLVQDMINFRVKASLTLEGRTETHDTPKIL
ncbi:MAG: hypothetical protein IJU31_05580 [Synergistaceae bacterium]|nr:hypothetical protein [Synergistaceae bacterium]